MSGDNDSEEGIKEALMSDTIVEIRVPSPILHLGIDRDEVQHRVIDAILRQAGE